MKETGITMSGDHPQKVLDGTKTMTRRVIKPQPYIVGFSNTVPYKSTGRMMKRECETCHHPLPDSKELTMINCPYGQVGDRLWVKETFWGMSDQHTIYYKAEAPVIHFPFTWKPSIHMPRWASRITLEITEVRVELFRVANLSPQELEAEGGESSLAILKDYEGKWVWVISFKKEE